jgi:hypothetical protein
LGYAEWAQALLRRLADVLFVFMVRRVMRLD